MQHNRYFTHHFFEPILLFCVIFLPGYALGAKPPEDIFNSYSFHAAYILTALPQLTLILYLAWRNGDASFFFTFRFKDIMRGLIIGASLLGSAMLLLPLIALLIQQLGLPEEQIHWSVSRASVLPGIFLSMFITGYLEEGYFRFFLFDRLEKAGITRPVAIGTCTLIFAAGHAYQGGIALIGTAIIGLILHLFRLKETRVHSLAIGHGLYNFCILALSLLYPDINT